MALSAGTRLGPYEILAPLGAGGMGEVYRARDTKLSRDVALKILPDTFASDSDRIARFRREAQVLASLNHPNIGHIYGLEDSSAPLALVLELIEGPTLADRIAQGPIPLAEAVAIARQITEALEVAHEHGVVHRDLKPANVKVRDDGAVKVLDFGLAKALDPTASSSNEVLNSPTLTARATQMGLVLGTAAYMSPEQAKGKSVDRRADIWAFGAVLYEMLSGRRPFEGDDISDTLAAVLRQDVNWNALPASTPPTVKRLIMRCLERDVRRRLRDIGEARIVLEDPSAGAAVSGIETNEGLARVDSRQPRWRRGLPIAGAATIIALLAGSAGWYFKPSPAGVVTRFRYSLPDDVRFSSLTRHVVSISRDGTEVVYIANNRLYVRRIWETDGQPVPGSDAFGAITEPVFSPDGRSLAFWTAFDSTIKKIPATGGAAVTLCQSDNPSGMSWSEYGIVFAQADRGTILRVSANGGTPEVIVSAKPGEILQGPQILPGGKHVLFAVTVGTGLDRWDKAQIVVQPLASGERQTIVANAADGRYLSSGHVAYATGGILFATPFDLSRLQTTPSGVPVVEGVRRGIPPSATGAAQYAVSDNGTLVYIPGLASAGLGSLDLALVDRNGTVKPLSLPPGAYAWPRVSPDGTRVAFEVDVGRDAFVAIYDLAGKTAMRPLTIRGNNRFPVWTSDSKRVAYQSDREGDLAIFWQAADGSGTVERLTKPNSGEAHIPEAWAPSSDTLLFSALKGFEYTLWTLSVPEKTIVAFDSVRSNGVPINSTFSPDGRWVAYQTNQDRRTTIYVQAMPPTGAVYQLLPRAADIPHEPVWSPDGKQLFYNPRAGGFESVSVTTLPEFAFGNPVPLPRVFQMSPPQARRSYDITRDGKFVGLILPGSTDPAAGSHIEFVVNWFDELKRRVSSPQ